MRRFLLVIAGTACCVSGLPALAAADSVSVTVNLEDDKTTYNLPTGTHFDGTLEETLGKLADEADSLTRQQAVFSKVNTFNR